MDSSWQLTCRLLPRCYTWTFHVKHTWQVSLTEQRLELLQGEPLSLLGLEHLPVAVSQIPATLHWSLAVQRVTLPMHVPFRHLSFLVQLFMSLHVVPSTLLVAMQSPVSGLQVPLGVTGSCTCFFYQCFYILLLGTWCWHLGKLQIHYNCHTRYINFRRYMKCHSVWKDWNKVQLWRYRRQCHDTDLKQYIFLTCQHMFQLDKCHS